MVDINRVTKKVAKIVLERDNYRCQLCGYRYEQIHHVLPKSYQGNNTEKNLICLCKRCHDKVHSNEKKYIDILMDLNRIHYGVLTKQDLKKKGKYSDYAIPN